MHFPKPLNSLHQKVRELSRQGHETGWQIASLSSYALGGTLLLAQQLLLSPCTPRGEGEGSPSAAIAAIPSVVASRLRSSFAAGAGTRPSADTGPGACTPMGEIGLNCLSRSTKAAGYRHSECKHLSGKILSRRAASKTALKNELRQRFVFQI